MKKVILCIFLFMSSGCTLNLGQRLIFNHDKFPEYQIINEPELQDLSGDELMPYKRLVEYSKSIYEDNIVTIEESNNYNKMLDDAKNNSQIAKDKIKNNIDALRIWGRKNESTLKIYNDFAKKMNERKISTIE